MIIELIYVFSDENESKMEIIFLLTAESGSSFHTFSGKNLHFNSISDPLHILILINPTWFVMVLIETTRLGEESTKRVGASENVSIGKYLKSFPLIFLDELIQKELEQLSVKSLLIKVLYHQKEERR